MLLKGNVQQMLKMSSEEVLKQIRNFRTSRSQQDVYFSKSKIDIFFTAHKLGQSNNQSTLGWNYKIITQHKT